MVLEAAQPATDSSHGRKPVGIKSKKEKSRRSWRLKQRNIFIASDAPCGGLILMSAAYPALRRGYYQSPAALVLKRHNALQATVRRRSRRAAGGVHRIHEPPAALPAHGGAHLLEDHADGAATVIARRRRRWRAPACWPWNEDSSQRRRAAGEVRPTAGHGVGNAGCAQSRKAIAHSARRAAGRAPRPRRAGSSCRA